MEGQLQTAGAGSAPGASTSKVLAEQNDGRGTYTLQAIISHIGMNAEHGHYVCHVKKGDRWIFFNDDKVYLQLASESIISAIYVFINYRLRYPNILLSSTASCICSSEMIMTGPSRFSRLVTLRDHNLVVS